MGFILKDKLKSLKTTLKQWNKENFGDVDFNIKSLVEDIKTLNLKCEEGGLSQEEMNKIKESLS